MASVPTYQLIISRDREALNLAAAEFWKRIAASSIAQHGRFSVALSGGSTPRSLFELLAQPPWSASLPWAKTHVFWGDERCVPADHPDSNFGMTHKALLSKIKIPAENIHRVPTELGAPEKIAAAYESTLREFFPNSAFPAFDLNLLGLGENGHTASLFPRTPVLHDRQHWVAGYFVDEIKANRVTLTAAAINHSREIAFLVAGESKGAVVRDVLHGPRDPERLPAQLIQAESGSLTWLLDQSAAKLLPNS